MAAWNPSDVHSSVILSNSNKTATKSGVNGFCCGRADTAIPAASKIYFEVVDDGSAQFGVGLATPSQTLASYVGNQAYGWQYFYNSVGHHSGSVGTIGPSYTATDVIGVAIDTNTGYLWFSKNGVWISGDPAAGTSPTFTDVTGELYPAFTLYTVDTSTGTLRTTVAEFSYSPPAGFSAYESSGGIDSITLTDIADNSVLQKSSPTQLIKTVGGTYTGTPTAVEYRVMQSTTTIVDWTTLDSAPSGEAFSGTATIPVGGPYTLEVRFSNDTGITDVGTNQWFVGSLFLIAPQSNGWFWFNDTGAATAHADFRIFDSTGWRTAGDADKGATAFGNKFIAVSGEPCGLVDAAESSIALRQEASLAGYLLSTLDERASVYTTVILPRLSACGSQIGGIVYPQGERDARSGVVTELEYQTSLATLFSYFREDTLDANLPIVVNYIGKGTSGTDVDTDFQAIRNAQKTVVDSDPYYYGVSIMDVALRDTIHDLDHTTRAERSAQALLYHYGLVSYYLGPQISGVSVVDSTTLDVNIVHHGGTDFTPTTGITGFEVFDDATPVTISSAVRQSATSIRLGLASAITGTASVRYQYGNAPDISGDVLDNSAMVLPLVWSDSLIVSDYLVYANDITESTALTGIDLTQQGILTINGLSCGIALDNISLSPGNQLVIQNISETITQSNISLVPQNTLSINNLAISIYVDNIDLTQQGVLSVFDIGQSYVLSNISLNVSGTLEIPDIVAGISTENIDLVQQHILGLEGITNNTTLDNLNLTQQNLLVVQNTDQATNTDNVALSTALYLILADISSSITASNISLIQQNTLSISDIGILSVLDTPNLIQQSILTVGDLGISSILENIDLSTVVILDVQSVVSQSVLENILLIQQNSLEIAGISATITSDTLDLVQQNTLIVDDALYNQISSNLTLTLGSNLPRFRNIIYIINTETPVFIASSSTNTIN